MDGWIGRWMESRVLHHFGTVLWPYGCAGSAVKMLSALVTQEQFNKGKRKETLINSAITN